ncbi:hypothetical protein FZ983_32220 [Azospirillum sp. B21]|uniref:helix-turn-helix domain-containing protein n=1 Tax=Azospirillum sp. B21 TaxID=2607496 RepID=UPI0011ED4147|nr:helix-turn-helix domain-containing protein [Azospirillum sp. B21]KAA0572238.1 hypothetical protein FZ983_32220 [Azospirillum sp. B21]
MLFRSVSHGEHSAPTASPEVTRRRIGKAAILRGISGLKIVLCNITRAVRRRLPPVKPSRSLAEILRLSQRQAQDKLNGNARWTLTDLVALACHFGEGFWKAAFHGADRAESPRRRRFSWRRAA